MSITCTIGGTSVNVKVAQPFKVVDSIEIPGQLTFTVEDSAGTLSFTRGQPVTLSDSTLGTLFTGYVLSSQPNKLGPASSTIEHYVTCTDKTYLLTKRENTTNYQNWYAGDVAVDFVEGTLVNEGITVAANSHRDTSTADFNKGVLSGTVGSVTTTGDGDLELAKAGSDLTITEATTADFNTGTLTNMSVGTNTLGPATVSGLSVSANLPFSANPSSIVINFWSGNQSLGTNDTFNVDIWIASTSPAITATVGLTFTDGTTTAGITDQNGLAIDATTDLTNYAKDQWYTRNFSTTTYNGKTVAYAWVSFGGTSQGTYTTWIKNVYLSSAASSPFFSTYATAPQLSPPVVASANNYLTNSVSSQVAQVFIPGSSTRTSLAYNIDSVKLLKSSVVTWIAALPSSSSFTLKASYDGGVTYQPCTNNGALPALPAGSNLTGLSITLQESFSAGSDPSVLPSLSQINIAIYSAPAATKSDIVTTFASQSAWNTGTLSGVNALVNGDLTSGSLIRDWNDNLITNQTFFTNGSGISQAASSGAYRITLPVSTSVIELANSRLDFAGTCANFTLDIDTTIPNTYNFSSVMFIAWRQTYWPSTPPLDFGTGGYTLQVSQTGGIYCNVVRGTNSSTDTQTMIKNLNSGGGPTGVTHVKIVCNGSHQQIYLNNSSTATFDFNDSTFSSGQIGVGCFTFAQNPSGSPNSGTFVFDNFTCTPKSPASWTGPATSISSLGTCGASVISWAEVNTGNSVQGAITVQSSVDGGSTYQTCTNGGSIPNLPSGTNVSGKNVQLKITLTTAGVTLFPTIRQLVWRVLGQYPGSSGTRSTVPMAMDTAVRANQSGLGTASDGQAWSKVGTVTDAVSSNTLTLTNTTGDAFEILGTRTWTDEEATTHFQLSASTITDGLILRYRDTNNYYRFSISTTTLTLYKKSTTFSNTLATASVSLSTATWYRARFRVSGSGPVTLQGRVWLDGTLEPTTWSITATD